MNIQIGKGVRPNSEFDLTIDPTGAYIEPCSHWSINCDKNEANYIKSDLDLIHFSEINKYIDLLISKLRLKGRLILYGFNLNEVNRLFYIDKISESDLNQIIYAADNKGIYTPSLIRDLLLQRKLEIISTKLSDFKYYIEATRC